MTKGLIVLLLASLAACMPVRTAAPVTAEPQTLADAQAARDWVNTSAAALDEAFATDVHSLLWGTGRENALAAIQAAGYACSFGEAHADYPEPSAQCTRSFATRACQLDWVIYLSTDPALPGEVDSLETGFRRDCVGTADDWPDPVVSAIDDQLAPAVQSLPNTTPE